MIWAILNETLDEDEHWSLRVINRRPLTFAPRCLRFALTPHFVTANKTHGKALFEFCISVVRPSLLLSPQWPAPAPLAPEILYTIVEMPDLHLDEMAVLLRDETDRDDMQATCTRPR